ncbi:MAG: molybdopterin oxidoreductase [Rhodospirillales bacterium]|nr:MAG: molybdopterin oxidoreductase [Rhodospirillales bacterium]
MDRLNPVTTRRRFLAATATGCAAGAAGLAIPGLGPLTTLAPASAALPRGDRRTVKNVCHQCPARCGIDVSVTDGRVHSIYGTLDHPISNGKLCPKGHLGTYILYDPDRFKGPMKRTNPNKGRNEDPRFVPITWDEALDTVAARLQALRDRDEAHRFALLYGRGWGASCAGLQGAFGSLYGSPNIAIGHSTICADGSKRAKEATDGNDSYNAYDYRNTNYLLNFGAGFLEAFRPYNYLMQMWGHMRRKSPKTRVTVVDVRLTTTGAAADRMVYIKPGTDGALALAIAHVMLTEGLWDRPFVGDFVDGVNRFRTGETIAPSLFLERWTHGLADWWNLELKDRTPAWASEITTIPVEQIVAVAREFGTTRPAIAIMERGPTSHTNGVYNGMAIHALNALAGSLFAVGGLMYQMGVPYGPLPVDSADYMDDFARAAPGRFPRIDLARTEAWPLAKTMIQDVARNHLAGHPYKLDTAMFYLTNPIWTAPEPQVWEEALKDVFVIDTSPFPGETAMYADLVLPDHTYLERLQDAPTYPFEGWPLTQLRTPAIPPLYDTKVYGDVLIEIGKRMHGPMGEYYEALGDTGNVIRHIAKGFADAPGDNGVDGYDSWVEKGVWYRKPYLWRQVRGEFLTWDGRDYTIPISAAEVGEKLLKTPSGKFEFRSGLLEKHAGYISSHLDIPEERVGLIQWVVPKYTGGGDLHFVTPKVPVHAEGRGANLPQSIVLTQPTVGGFGEVYLEINPETAKARGIAHGGQVRISSEAGSIVATAHYYAPARPDTLVLPMEHGHWAQGRWAVGRLPGNSSEVTVNVSEPISGLACYYSGTVTIEPIDGRAAS